MRLEVLVDDLAPEGLMTVHGFSALVKTEDITLLFDTGPSPEALVEGLTRAGVGFRDIDQVVISHSHRDHSGGLGRVVYEVPRIPVSAPRGAAADIVRLCPRETVVIGDDVPREIAPGVRVTGDLGGSIPEQALLVESSAGQIVVVGCGHPGLDRIIAAAGGEVRLLVGGLHDLTPEMLPIPGVNAFLACHCTPNKRSLAHQFDEVELGWVGTVVEIE